MESFWAELINIADLSYMGPCYQVHSSMQTRNGGVQYTVHKYLYLVGPFVPPWGIIYQLVELQAASLSFSNITVYNSPFEPVEYF